MNLNKLSRRRLLTTLGVGTGTYMLRDFLVVPSANAGSGGIEDMPRVIYCQIPGGWDALLGLDPRDNTKYNDPDNPEVGIETAYDQVAATDTNMASVLASTGGTGILQAGNIGFGPACGRLAEGKHHERICLVRGISMGTLTHEVGRRYFLTGKFPRGLAASGSAMGTKVASQDAGLWPIPNLVSGVETYNEGLDPKASGLVINSYLDLGAVLKSLDPTLTVDDATADAIADYHAKNRCVHEQLNVTGKVDAQRAGWEKALVFAQGTLFSHFNFVKNPPPGSEIAAVYNAFGIDPVNPTPALSTAAGQAAIAAQAITQNISQAVSLSLTNSVDHHDDDWATNHAPAMRAAFNAIADLMAFLGSVQIPGTNMSYLDRTTILCASDFARTPKLNVRGGRDHHLYAPCLLAGAGIKGNMVIGATDDSFAGTSVNPATGAADPEGILIRPPDVHATLFKAMGLEADHISNQDPVVLDAVLAS